MASESNGSGWIWKVVTAIMIPAFVMLTNYVIANDKESRDRDNFAEDKLTIMCQKQQEVNQQILVKLASIETELKYRNGRTAN